MSGNPDRQSDDEMHMAIQDSLEGKEIYRDMESKIEEFLKERHLCLDKNTRGGGNCQFDAIARQIQVFRSDYNYSDNYDYNDVRRDVLNCLRSNSQYREHVNVTGILFGRWFDDMSKPGTWGDENTLQAASDLYRRPIDVHQFSTLDNKVVTIRIKPHGVESPFIHAFQVGFIPELHYYNVKNIQTTDPESSEDHPLQSNQKKTEEISLTKLSEGGVPQTLEESAFESTQKEIRENLFTKPIIEGITKACELKSKTNTKTGFVEDIEKFNTFLRDKKPFKNIDKLQDHQVEGVQVVLKNVTDSDLRGALLAHTMGAGKTLQSLALMKILTDAHNFSRFVVVCPLSLFEGWVEEISALFDDNTGPTRKSHNIFIFTLRKVNILVLTPDALRGMASRTKDRMSISQFMDQRQKALMIVDEAHSMKSSQTEFTQSLQAIKSQYPLLNFVLLSGTPLQNTIGELLTMVNFLLPKKEWAWFQTVLEFLPGAMQRLRDSANKSVGSETQKFKELMSQIISLVQFGVSPLVHRIGDELINNILTESGIHLVKYNVLFNILDYTPYAACLEQGGSNVYLNTSMISWGLLKDPVGSKIVQKIETPKSLFLRNFMKNLSQGPRSVIFFFLNTAIGERAYEIIQSTLEENQKGLVEFVSGTSVPGKNRKKIFDKFNGFGDSEVRYLVLQEEIGGVGVNLQHKGTVVVYLQSLDWNPALTRQSMARVWRFGQKRDCFVINLMTQFSTEAIKYNVNVTKSKISDAFLDSIETEDHNAQSNTSKLSELRDLSKEALKGPQRQGSPDDKANEDKNIRAFLDTRLAYPSTSPKSADFQSKWTQALQGGPFLDMEDITAHNLPVLEELEELHPAESPVSFRIQKLGEEEKREIQKAKELEGDDAQTQCMKLTQNIRFLKSVCARRAGNTTPLLHVECSSKPWRQMVQDIRCKLLETVYYCPATKLYLYENGVETRPPLFWPGVDILGQKIKDEDTNCLQYYMDRTAGMESYKFRVEAPVDAKAKGLSTAKVKLVLNKEELRTSDHFSEQGFQSLIDAVQFCLHICGDLSLSSDQNIDPGFDWSTFVIFLGRIQKMFQVTEDSKSGLPLFFSIPEPVCDSFISDKNRDMLHIVALVKTSKKNAVMDFEQDESSWPTSIDITSSTINYFVGTKRKHYNAVADGFWPISFSGNESPPKVKTFLDWMNPKIIHEKYEYLDVLSVTCKEEDDNDATWFMAIKDGGKWWAFRDGSPEEMSEEHVSEFLIKGAVLRFYHHEFPNLAWLLNKETSDDHNAEKFVRDLTESSIEKIKIINTAATTTADFPDFLNRDISVAFSYQGENNDAASQFFCFMMQKKYKIPMTEFNVKGMNTSVPTWMYRKLQVRITCKSPFGDSTTQKIDVMNEISSLPYIEGCFIKTINSKPVQHFDTSKRIYDLIRYVTNYCEEKKYVRIRTGLNEANKAAKEELEKRLTGGNKELERQILEGIKYEESDEFMKKTRLKDLKAPSLRVILLFHKKIPKTREKSKTEKEELKYEVLQVLKEKHELETREKKGDDGASPTTTL